MLRETEEIEPCGSDIVVRPLGGALKRPAKLVLIAIGIVSIAYIGFLQLRTEVVHVFRRSSYQQRLSRLQRDLRPGMARAQIDSYLASQRINYGLMGGDSVGAWSYHVLIGREPGDGLVCDHWNEYLSINFNPTETKNSVSKLSPQDTLRDVKLIRIGQCL